MQRRGGMALLLLTAGLAACGEPAAGKLDTLGVNETTRAALGRLRWAALHEGDPVDPGDLVLCGEGDQVVLAFSRKLMSAYLGIDAEALLPELFTTVNDTEVLFALPGPALMRLSIPGGIG